MSLLRSVIYRIVRHESSTSSNMFSAWPGQETENPVFIPSATTLNAHGIIKNTPPHNRKKRRALAALGGLAMCLVLPLTIFQVLIYRQNLAMAQEQFPVAPTFSAQDRILVLSPHCDDETLGVGGTIAAARAAGAAVRVVFLTNGDGSRSTQIAEGAKHPGNLLHHRNSFEQLAKMRQQETVAALHELGVAAQDVIFLGYPDSGTKEMWENYWSPNELYRSSYTGATHSPYENSHTPGAVYCGSQALQDVTESIAAWKPTVIFTTHPSDTHPDHWAAYAYTRAALESLRLRPATRDWATQVQLLTFLVHRGLWPAPHGYHPDAHLAPPALLKNIGTQWTQAPLDVPSRTAKKAALERYVSQLAFTPQYLRGFLRRDELFGALTVNDLRVPNFGSSHGESNGSSPATSDSLVLVQDPSHDSLLHDAWASADIKDISLLPISPVDALTLQIGLAKPVSSRLHYRVCVHTVSPDTARSWIITVRWQNDSWHAVVRKTGEEVPLHLTANGFTVALPREVQQLSNQAYTLLVSASSYLGSTWLDQTETGTLRVELPVPIVKKPAAKRSKNARRVLTS